MKGRPVSRVAVQMTTLVLSPSPLMRLELWSIL